MGLLYGVGINDSPYPVGGGKTVCPFYATWKRMLQRAYSEKFHVKNPTYKNVWVCTEWLRFTTFREWMVKQRWEGMQLDKDFRTWGNTTYSPDTCAFIPHQINSLLQDVGDRQGALPTGVYFVTTCPNTPYRARVRIGNKIKHLGYFATPEKAHAAWCHGKARAIKETLAWWENSPEINHSYNEEAGYTLSQLASYLQQFENKDRAYAS